MCFFQSTDGSFTAAGSMDGCVVQNCDLSGINATDAGGNDAAIWFQGCKNGIAQGNYIHDINKSNDISHCHGIESYGCTNLQWINNTFYNCTGGAMEPKEGNSGIIAAYNYIYSCATVASGNYAVFQAWDGAQGNPNSPNVAFSIHHNIVDSCGRVTFGESNNANHTMALNWYNNTVYESGQIVLQSTGGGGLMNHYNNIDVLATPTTAYKQFTTSGWTTLDYNCMYVENSTYTSVWQESGTNYSSLAAWQAAPGAPDAHGITSDPKFTPGTLNIVAGGGPSQFKLQGGSPCVGTGQGGVDMGAWQGQTTIGCGFGPYA